LVVFGRLVARVDEDAGMSGGPGDPGQGSEAGEGRLLEVEDDDVGLELAGETNRLMAVGSFATIWQRPEPCRQVRSSSRRTASS